VERETEAMGGGSEDVSSSSQKCPFTCHKREGRVGGKTFRMGLEAIHCLERREKPKSGVRWHAKRKEK